MSEPDSADRQREDPADALAKMAEGQDEDAGTSPDSSGAAGDATAALDELAEDRTDPVVELDDLADAEQEPVDPEVAAATGISRGQAFQARRARGAKIAGQQARAHAHLYKKTMIPLLLVIGVMLIVVGLASASMLVAADVAEERYRWHAWMTGIALVSFPLGAILFLGAWLFHRDVERSPPPAA